MFKKTRICTGLALAFGSGMFVGATPAIAQDAPQRVEITGSSIKRTELEGALPVQVITREEISRSGVINTEQLMLTISSNSSLGGLSVTQGAGNSIYGRSEVSLRGLGSERTLVLVNGRRIAAFAGGGGTAVNVNAIPLAAIERVEVLTDGASSVYGSDAVGGVINFILAKNVTGITGDFTYGTPTRSGGGQNTKVGIVGGIGDMTDDKYNVTLSASHENEKQLKATDREFAKTGNVPPYLVAGATGQGNIEGGYKVGTGSASAGTWVEGSRLTGFGTSPGAGYGNPLAAKDLCSDIKMFKNPTNTSKGAPYCAYDSAQDVMLVPDRESTGITVNGAWHLSEAVELFGDVLYSKNTVTQRIQPSPVRRSFLTPADTKFQEQGIDPVLLIFPSNPNYKTAADYLNAQFPGSAIVGQPLAITSRVFDFGLRTSKDTSEQTRFTGGLRGTMAGQDYEVGYSHNESKLEGSVIDGYFSQVAYAKVVQGSNDWNPWSLTQSDAFNSQLPAAKYVGPTLNSKSKSDVFDGKLTGDVIKLPAGMLQYAAGMQYRKEKYINSPAPALETGDIAGLGGGVPAVDKSRNVTAFFGELNVPVVKGLDLGVAARNDDYSDVGRSNTYKGNVRWQPINMVLLRASLGTGFRAPTLEDLYRPQTVGTSAQFNDPAFPDVKNLQVPELSGGNPDLKAETSKQNSIGIVFAPNSNSSIGLDFWHIKIDGILSTPSTQEIVTRYRQGDSAYKGLVTLTADGQVDQTKAILANVGSADVDGVDLSASYRQNLGPGNLGLAINGTYMQKYNQTTPGGVTSHKVGTMVDENGDPVLDADSGGVVLRWKHYMTATWTQGDWGVTLAQNYYRGYETGRRQIDGERNFVPSQAIYDAQVAWGGIKDMKVSLGIKNLFDKNPPIYVPVSNQFQAGYDVSQYDARSRYVYLSASYKFF
jgi:iron complex outermembrane receptor protein